MNYVWAFLFVPIYQVYWKISRIESHLTQAGEKRKKGKGKSSLRHPFKELLYPFCLNSPVGKHCLILTNCFSIFHDKQSRLSWLCCQICIKSISIVFFCVRPERETFVYCVQTHTKSHILIRCPSWKLKCNCVFIILLLSKRTMLLSGEMLIQCPSQKLCLFDFRPN